MIRKLTPFFLITILIITLTAIPVTQQLLHPQPQWLNPLNDSGTVLSATTPDETENVKRKTILGFLPYWLLNETESLHYDQLTDIAYFGIEFDDQGKLMTHLDDGSKELGLHRLNTSDTVTGVLTQARLNNVNRILVVKILNNDGIIAAIDPANRDQVITEILQMMTDHQFNGLNIDFEYIGSPPTEIKNNFTEFIKKLRQKTTNEQSKTDNVKRTTLSIDIHADAADKQSERLWQLADLAPHLDYFIVMGYDFYRPTSPAAGPIAPIHGAPGRWQEDLITSLRAFTKIVPANKLVLGTAFYGYEWPTQNSQINATAASRGYLATYARVQEIIADCHNPASLLHASCSVNFDSEALSPYINYTITKPATRKKSQPITEYHQIWYENAKSLEYKLQLVRDADLAGIAIWALGYESPFNELWQTIGSK